MAATSRPVNFESSALSPDAAASAGSVAGRAERLLVAAALATAAVWLWLSWCIFPLRSWNDIRLAPTFALTLGLPLYPGLDGPASTWMYGPLPVWLNWPATWAPGPGAALLVAGAINALVGVAAIVAVCLLWPVPSCSSHPLTGRLLATAVTVAIWPWANWQFLQADNFAVALGLLANLALVRSPMAGAAWLAAGLATAGMMCKQTSLGVPLGQVAWLAVTLGPRSASSHVVRLCITGCAWLAILFMTNDPARAWFTAVVTPAGLPWVAAPFDRLLHLLPHIAVHIALPVAAWIFLAKRHATSELLLPTLTWLIAWLPGLASAFKAGGTLNCLQGFLLWLPPAAVVVIASLSGVRWGAAARCGLALVALGMLVGRIATRPVRMWQPLAAVAVYDDALDLSRELPVMVWFPWNPLVTVFSEGRLYHVEDGLYVRSLIGKTFSEPDDRRYLPERFAAITVSNQGSTWGIAEPLLHGPLQKIDLGSWTLFRSPKAPPITVEEVPR